MQNLKIRVNSIDEGKEIQNILESKGFKKWAGWSELGSIGGFIWTDSDMTYCDNEIEYFDESPRKEITIPELRAMVNPMKEYLDANRNYEFVLSTEKDDGFIEIPEGAEALTKEIVDSEEMLLWWRDSFNKCIGHDDQLSNHEIDVYNHLERTPKPVILWQRDQDEPFLTPECALNDQYAEIEQVRQSHRTASEIADSALKHIRERAETYDQPTGERSAAKTAKAFNAITGKDITESEVWLLLQLLKDVRQWSREDYHQDSAEDCIAYASLKAESLESGK